MMQTNTTLANHRECEAPYLVYIVPKHDTTGTPGTQLAYGSIRCIISSTSISLVLVHHCS